MSFIIRNEEEFVLFKKIFEKFKKRRQWKNEKIRNKNHPKNQENVRNGPITIYHDFL